MTSPRSRRERPAKPALTRAGIVAVAVLDELLGEVGLNAGGQLGRAAGSRARLVHLSPGTHPYLATAGADLISGDPGERMTWSWRALLSGIAATP